MFYRKRSLNRDLTTRVFELVLRSISSPSYLYCLAYMYPTNTALVQTYRCRVGSFRAQRNVDDQASEMVGTLVSQNVGTKN